MAIMLCVFCRAKIIFYLVLVESFSAKSWNWPSSSASSPRRKEGFGIDEWAVTRKLEEPRPTTADNNTRTGTDVEFEQTEQEILARVDERITLHCYVKNLGDNVISWIKRKDLQILTSGIVTFAADRRFQVEHFDEEPNSWNLVINSVQKSDSGVYECQINTEPKLKKIVFLSIYSGNGVADYSEEWADERNNEKEKITKKDTQSAAGDDNQPIATILGQSELYIHFGSALTLICHVKSNDARFTFDQYFLSTNRRAIKWLQFSNLLTADSERGGISIDTIRYPNLIASRLTIAKVTNKDAGPYTCKPAKGLADVVYANIIQNEQMEATKPENYILSSKALANVDDGHWRKFISLFLFIIVYLRR